VIQVSVSIRGRSETDEHPIMYNRSYTHMGINSAFHLHDHDDNDPIISKLDGSRSVE